MRCRIVFLAFDISTFSPLWFATFFFFFESFFYYSISVEIHSNGSVSPQQTFSHTASRCRHRRKFFLLLSQTNNIFLMSVDVIHVRADICDSTDSKKAAWFHRETSFCSFCHTWRELESILSLFRWMRNCHSCATATENSRNIREIIRKIFSSFNSRTHLMHNLHHPLELLL